MISDDDLLSELLTPLRLRGVFSSFWTARAPWGVRGATEHRAIIHYVVSGECSFQLTGTGEAITLRAGDLAVFPHGAAHDLTDRPGRPTVPLDGVLSDRPSGGTRTASIGGDGPSSTFLCGGLEYDEVAESPLYRTLPPVVVLTKDVLATEPLLPLTLNRLAADAEQREPGAKLVALRAFELVFVLALRLALTRQDSATLRALKHPGVSKALLAVHTRFAEPWTLESMAREAGMSRSAFAATFRDLVGEAPAKHLTGRRLQEATRLLTETALPQNRIAERVGYQSPVGFLLAFRRTYAMTPGDYRRSRRVH